MTTESKAAVPPPAPTIVVPANARAIRCKCGKEFYFVRMDSGARMPVDCAVPDGRRPMPAATQAQREKFALRADEGQPRDGLGVSHYYTCANANEFSGRNA